MARATNSGGDRILWTEEGSKAKPIAIKFNFLLFSAFLTLLFIGGSLFYVWSRIQVIRLGYEISDALKKERGLTEANKKFRLEIATLKSYARIERIAIEELRMTKPKPDQVIVIQ